MASRVLCYKTNAKGMCWGSLSLVTSSCSSCHQQSTCRSSHTSLQTERMLHRSSPLMSLKVMPKMIRSSNPSEKKEAEATGWRMFSSKKFIRVGHDSSFSLQGRMFLSLQMKNNSPTNLEIYCRVATL